MLVDLLFASSGIDPEIVEHAELTELLPGTVVALARAPHLAVLKLLARDDITRPQDASDLRALRSVLTRRDVDEVRRLARLIPSRGYHRGRDLEAPAGEYLAQT